MKLSLLRRVLVRLLPVFLFLNLFWILPLSAETQNVKVSGSLDVYWFYRQNFDLQDDNDSGTVPIGTAVQPESHPSSTLHRSEADDYWMSIAQIEVDAELTDNVTTVINLVNQRDWNAASDEFGVGIPEESEFNVKLDLAYAEMREIFYAPLTLTFGRQDISFGRGFFIGANYLNVNGIQASEYTALTAFDAVRATLDFNPWTLDFVYTKIVEGAHDPEDDRDIYMVNVNYKFSEYEAVAEAYLFSDSDRNTLAGSGTVDGDTRNNITHTVGGRVQFDPISQITLGAEMAYQFGDYRTTTDSPERDRDAWAFNLFGEYRWDYEWKPKITVEYAYFSGEEDLTETSTQSYSSWNNSFRSIVYGYVHDDLESYYATAQPNDPLYSENQQILSFTGALFALEDLEMGASYLFFWTTEDIHSDPSDLASPTLSDEIGQEIDLYVTYAYTEDVTFSWTAGWFMPGDLYEEPFDAKASEVVSAVSVKF